MTVAYKRFGAAYTELASLRARASKGCPKRKRAPPLMDSIWTQMTRSAAPEDGANRLPMRWAGQDSNLRPTDYESAALTI
jgi:hypothetical protein